MSEQFLVAMDSRRERDAGLDADGPDYFAVSRPQLCPACLRTDHDLCYGLGCECGCEGM